MLIHTHVSTNTAVHPPSRMAVTIPSADMIEPSWDTAEDGVRICREYGAKPGALIIAYRTLTMPLQGSTVCGDGPLPESAWLHHKDGKRWRVIEIEYGQRRAANSPGEQAWAEATGFLNPKDRAVMEGALGERARLRALGYAGVRYDETVVGWGAGNAIDFSDCKEFSSAASYAYQLAALLRELRVQPGGWIQLPSIIDPGAPDVSGIFSACRGISTENFPAGHGLTPERWATQSIRALDVDYDATERSVCVSAAMASALRRIGARCDVMAFARFPLGLGAVSGMVAGFSGSRVFFNLDSMRDMVTGQFVTGPR